MGKSPIQERTKVLLEHYQVAYQAFETAAKKMGKECPECEGCGGFGFVKGDGRLAPRKDWREAKEETMTCSVCKGTGTIGPSPLDLAEWAQNGEIAELIWFFQGVECCLLCDMNIKVEGHAPDCILAKIP